MKTKKQILREIDNLMLMYSNPIYKEDREKIKYALHSLRWVISNDN